MTSDEAGRVGPPPQKSTGRELAETSLEAGLNAVPLVGGVVAVATMAALSHTFNRRAAEWLESVGGLLDELAGRVEDLESGVLGFVVCRGDGQQGCQAFLRDDPRVSA